MNDFDVEVTANVTLRAAIRSVSDLRSLVAELDKYRVSGTAIVEFGYDVAAGQFVWISPLGEDAVPAGWIECGDHLLGDEHYDVLVETHSHPEHHGRRNQPATFDWPAKDRLERYGDDRRPE